MVSIEELNICETEQSKSNHGRKTSLDVNAINVDAPSTPAMPEENEGTETSPCSNEQQQDDLQEAQARLARVEQLRASIATRVASLLSANPQLPRRSLSDLNTEATQLCKANDYIGSVSIYSILFTRASQLNLTHPELYVCHSNCAAAYLKLEMHEEALEHAGHCERLAKTSLRRNFKGSSSYIKSFLRKGQALVALGRYREAVSTFEAGLSLDPCNLDMKLGLEKANQGVLRDLAEGKGHEHRSITYPEPSQRITYHAYSAPLHKVRTEDLLPVKLLTPFQAENDHNIKDTYNYMTVQADIRMPTRMFRQLEDPYYNGAWKAAIEGAVAEVEASDTDCRVLNLGAGAGVQAMTALQAGARHVTAAERWFYLALACKETLDDNKADEAQYKVLYKRPTDLKIKEDVPVCCNVVVANILDEGLLTSGIIPAVRHALGSLATHGAVVLPASATVYMQAVELRTTNVCGLDMSAANLYRWHPAYATGAPLNKEAVRTLSAPVPVWYFNFGSPPEASDVKTIDVEFTAEGRFNAVMFWYDLHLWGDAHLSSGPEAADAAPGQRYLQPAVQYLAGELRVDPGNIMPIIASHNTVGMRFDIETADYLHLMKTDASFPHRHFNMLADQGRLAAYDRAIARAIARRKETDNGEAHVLDMGTGTGVLALMAARAGATSVVACDLHKSLCDIARKAASQNGLGSKISVVQRDVALLQRGKEVRPLGVNVVVADMFDAGLTGDQFPYVLELTRKKVVQPGATVVPAAATLYCMGIEALTGEVSGVNMASFNTYRWDTDYVAVRLADLPHRRLTKPAKVSETFFDGEKRPRARDSLVKLDVIETGTLNAVVFWFDLHLDDVESLTSAPAGVGLNGEVLIRPAPATADAAPADCSGSEQEAPNMDAANDAEPLQTEHYWGQALQYLDRAVNVEAARRITLLAKKDGFKTRLALRPGVGEWVGRAPWKIEWGGGASIENPHYQRIHYCELLVRDFLMRCKSQRFPSIQKDINMVLAHCGSLFLDPGALEEVGHELVVLEKLHTNPDFSPGASLEALTRPQLRRC